MQSVQSILPVSIVPAGAAGDPVAPEGVFDLAFGEIVDQVAGESGGEQRAVDCAAAAVWPVPAWVAGFGAAAVAGASGDGLAVVPETRGSTCPVERAVPIKCQVGADLPSPPDVAGLQPDGQAVAQETAIAAVRVGGHVADGPEAAPPAREDRPATDICATAALDTGQVGSKLEMPPRLPDAIPVSGSPVEPPAATERLAASVPSLAPSRIPALPSVATPLFAAPVPGRASLLAGPEAAIGVDTDPAEGVARVPSPGLDGTEGLALAERTATSRPGRSEGADTRPEAAASADGVAEEPGAAATGTGTSLALFARDTSTFPDSGKPEGTPGDASIPRPPTRVPTPQQDIPPTRPVPQTPERDAFRPLSPGVWEQLFSGIIAPPSRTEEPVQTVAAAAPQVAGVPPPKVAAPMPLDDSQSNAGEDATVPDAARPRTPASLPEPPVHSGADLTLRAPEPAAVEDTQRKWMAEADFPGAGLSGLAATAAPNPGSGTAPPALTAAALPVPQLAAQIGAALSQSPDGTTELALSPEELGKVRLRLKPDAANPDRLMVMITCDRPETLDLFRRHASELTDAFRQAGYAGANIGFGQQGSGQPDPERRDGTGGQSSLDAMPRPDAGGAAPPAPRHASAASLDLRL